MTTPEEKEPTIFERDLVFFDTETTGLAFASELLEIGLVKVKARTLEVLAEEDIKLNPVHLENADPESLRIVGFDREEWERDGVGKKEGLARFLRHTENCLLVGHNVTFDILHVERELFEHGLQPNYFYKPLDTFSLSWAALGERPEFEKYSLRELAVYFNVDQGRAHRAIDDARTTYQVFKKLHELKKVV